MIETGFKKLDQCLGGGIKEGLITDIYGQTATGKTQLTFQICLNALKSSKEVLFQDTTGGFRPERILEMMEAQQMDPALLDKIKVGRITNTSQQIQYLLNKPIENFSLIIIDSVTDLFSFEYSKKEHIIEKNVNFGNYMIKLSKLTQSNNIPVIITNQVLSHDDISYQRMHIQLENYVHQKIQLEKIKKRYTCKVSSPFIFDAKFDYKITNSGIEETESI